MAKVVAAIRRGGNKHNLSHRCNLFYISIETKHPKSRPQKSFFINSDVKMESFGSFCFLTSSPSMNNSTKLRQGEEDILLWRNSEGMGRAPCCEKIGLRRGRWTKEEDEILTNYIQVHGEGSWRSLPKNAGLLRCGKSCRLRWINYLRADLKRGNITPEEQQIIVQLHSTLGNRWSLIAGHLPGRTDNEIKNYWNSHVSRRIHDITRTIKTMAAGSDRPPPTAMIDAATVTTPKKRKGRTSRSCMKRNVLLSSSLKWSDNLRATSVPIIKEQVESTGMHGSHVEEVDEEAKLLGLEPYEWPDGEMIRLEEFLLQGEGIDLDAALEGLEEIESGDQVPGHNHGTSPETEKVVFRPSSGESNGEWYSNSSNNNNISSSSSVNDWFDWDWMMKNDEETSDNDSSPKVSQAMIM